MKGKTKLLWVLLATILMGFNLAASCGSEDNDDISEGDASTDADTDTDTDADTDTDTDTDTDADTDTNANGDCYEEPQYPGDEQAQEGSVFTATGTYDTESVEFNCQGSEIEYRLEPQLNRYRIKCASGEYAVELRFPLEVTTWTHEGVANDNPNTDNYCAAGIALFKGFTALSNGDTGADGGTLTVESIDDCTMTAKGSFQADYVPVEMINKPGGTISGSFTVIP